MDATRAHAIGRLCLGGDWACACGDFAALRYVLEQLAAYVREPLHCELIRIADTCGSNPSLASTQWMRVKDHVYRCA